MRETNPYAQWTRLLMVLTAVAILEGTIVWSIAATLQENEAVMRLSRHVCTETGGRLVPGLPIGLYCVGRDGALSQPWSSR
jgi:hypothetical protein